MNDYDKNDLKMFGAIAGIFCLAMFLLFCFCYVLYWVDCKSFETTGYETQYRYGSCYAKVDGKWLPSEFVFGKAQELRIK